VTEWGAVITALEAHWRSVNPDAPAGEQGWERGLRPGESLLDAELPHAFAHNPAETTGEIETGAQEEIALSVQIDTWTRGETQEQAIARLDAFRERLRGDPTLGGLVDRVRVLTRSVVEFSGRPERAGLVIVATERVF